MMSYEYLHEVETVELRSSTLRTVSELLPVLERLGFTLHDDVVSLDRNGTIPPWQHSSIIEVEVLCNDHEVTGFEEGEWNAIRLKYLFASLPFELVDQFVEVALKLSRKLATSVSFRGTNVNVGDLKDRFDQIRDEVLSETGEDAGSEGLAIVIHGTYPRRQTN
jgi:hypothetical protein